MGIYSKFNNSTQKSEVFRHYIKQFSRKRKLVFKLKTQITKEREMFTILLRFVPQATNHRAA